MSATGPFASTPATRFVAFDVNATTSPSPLIAGAPVSSVGLSAFRALRGAQCAGRTIANDHTMRVKCCMPEREPGAGLSNAITRPSALTLGATLSPGSSRLPQ